MKLFNLRCTQGNFYAKEKQENDFIVVNGEVTLKFLPGLRNSAPYISFVYNILLGKSKGIWLHEHTTL
jgi:hypothetical protein